jgi:Domain of unknown function (DUF222)
VDQGFWAGWLSVVAASVSVMDIGLPGDLDLEDLDASATLAAVEASLQSRRRAEADDLGLAAHWADLHASDPQLGPGGRREWAGDDRLVDVGGDGTPMVQELCLVELAISRRVHPHAARRLVADALDLRHRLPTWWKAVQELRLEAWLARKAATMCRDLDLAAVRRVDAGLPAELGEVSPARLLEVVKAQVIAADPAAHAAKLEAEKRRRYVSLSRTDEFGLRHVIARVRAGDAVWVDAMVERVADLLASSFPDGTTKDVLRSEAFGWLARPAELLQLLLDGVPEPTVDQADLADAIRSIDPAKLRPQAVMYLHLHEAAVRTDLGLVRVEEIGPVLSSEIPAWLGHANVSVRPVVDLADQVAFDCYEHLDSLDERIHLRSPADSFPHASQVTRRLDDDHVIPYVPGVRGQTGDHNAQPLGRTGHRAKTHAGYRVRQLGPGDYVWRTPHGRYRRVNHLGTTVLTEPVGSGLISDDPIDRAVAQMTLELQLTGVARVPRELVPQ